MNEKWIQLLNRWKYTLAGGGIWGLIAHGFMFTNKISFHDDIGQLFSMGQTFPVGRWFLGLISKFMDKSIGIYSLPWLNGIISLTFITISACLITELLGIKSILGKVLVGGVMAVFPVVASIYLFMFTSAAYFAALLMMLFSLWLIEHYKSELPKKLTLNKLALIGEAEKSP